MTKRFTQFLINVNGAGGGIVETNLSAIQPTGVRGVSPHSGYRLIEH